MKRYFLIFIMIFMVGTVSAVQPMRKPFIQIKIDGKSIRNGDIVKVNPVQKLMIGVELEGGRRDFCNFPDTYADIAGTAQILSRGRNGLTYQLNGKKAEWKLQNEDIRFTSDDFVKVTSQANQSTAEISISNSKFSQSFVKITIKATWQFIQDGITTQEENLAEGMVYFRVAGTSDVWFTSQNIQASGIKNDLVQENLTSVQSACDSIEKDFYRLNFSAVQQAIRILQSKVDTLKSVIDKVKASNPSYQTKVVFIGLPSNQPYSHIDVLSAIISSWVFVEPLVNELKQQLGILPAQPTKESKDELSKIISQYIGWQNKLPENTFSVLTQYIPDINLENIKIPENIHIPDIEINIANYSQIFNDFNAFLNQRILNVPEEIQKINSTQARLQAVRIFDGMLRSYFSSINWAEWKSTRGY